MRRCLIISLFVSGIAVSVARGDDASLLQVTTGPDALQNDPAVSQAGTSAVSLASDEDAALCPVTRVLIPALPRSGSTLLHDMLSKPVTTRSAQWLQRCGDQLNKFALFEPCHDKDVYREGNVKDFPTCLDMLSDINHCDFHDIDSLFDWSRWHYPPGAPPEYTKNGAHEACRKADLIVTKTVSQVIYREPTSLSRILERMPALKAVVNVRDPRGVFASWKRVFHWNGLEVNREKMRDFCSYYAGLANLTHPRVTFVKFEDIVMRALPTARRLFQFLNFAFGPPQIDWLDAHFWHGNQSLNNCSGVDLHGNFSTCRQHPQAIVSRWRRELSMVEKSWFEDITECRVVANRFSYS